MSSKAARLRAEADRIEEAELLAERLKTADTIPTCPECGGRSFKIYAWTEVGQSIDFERDEEAGDWDDDYESGDHTDQNASARCNHCDHDMRRTLEAHGWTFYADPAPADKLSVTDPE